MTKKKGAVVVSCIVILLAAVPLMGIRGCLFQWQKTGFTGSFLCSHSWGEGVWDLMEYYYDLYQYEDGDIICWFTDWDFDDYDLWEEFCWGHWDGEQFEIEFQGAYGDPEWPDICNDTITGYGIDEDGDGYFDVLEGTVVGDCPDGIWDKESVFSAERTWTPN